MAVFLSEHSDIFAFFSERSDGAMGRINKREEQLGSDFRQKFFLKHRIESESTIAPFLVHGSDVYVVSDPCNQFHGSVDGLVTLLSGVCLTVTAADCAAVYFWDPKIGIIGICHAGWKGVCNGVASNTVLQMKKLGSTPSRIYCAVSPAIGQCCFEVGREVAENFPKECLRQNPGEKHKFFLDLKLAIKRQLMEAGVQAKNIEINPDCTRCMKNKYFSYRGGDDPESGEVMIAGIIKKSGF